MKDKKANIDVFIAYARKDVHYLDELRIYLKPLDRDNTIKIWYDGEIVPGTVWEKQIKTNLHDAEIILLLVSAYSLASDYFYDTEMKEALERHRQQQTIVVPVILSDCNWEGTDLKDLQVLPRDAKPIKSWEDETSAYANIVRGIVKSIEEVKNRRTNFLKQAEDKKHKAEEEESLKEKALAKINLKERRLKEEKTVNRQKGNRKLEKTNEEKRNEEEALVKRKAEEVRLLKKEEVTKREQEENIRQSRQQEEKEAWAGLENKESITGLNSFIKKYPQSKYIKVAKDRLSGLNISKKKRNKNIIKWLAIVLFVPIVIWGITILTQKNNKSMSENELKIYQDENSKLWGYKKGSIITILPNYSKVTEFKDGIAEVTKNGNTYFINTEEECIRNCPKKEELSDPPKEEYKLANEALKGPSKAQIEYDDLIRQADDYYTAMNYRNALSTYQSAKGKVEDDLKAIQGIKNCERKLAEIDIIHQRKKNEEEKKYTNSGIVSDIDGNIYKWLRLNDGKKWLTKNLNLKIDNSMCYENDVANCKKYGRLYTYEAAKKACASLGVGWRLPSYDNWADLNSNSRDVLNLLWGGGKNLYNEPGFRDLGFGGTFWGADHTMKTDNSLGSAYEGSAMSCRCIKD